MTLLGLSFQFHQHPRYEKWDGVDTVRKTIGLWDMSIYSIDITLWGEHCQIEGAELANLCGLDTPPAVVIKGDRVTDFNGKTIGTISNTTIFINPKIEETVVLQR